MSTERQVMQDYLDALVKRADFPAYFTDDGKAAIEADFAGTHTGEFAGIPATGRDVRVPYSVLYNLRATRSARCASTSP